MNRHLSWAAALMFGIFTLSSFSTASAQSQFIDVAYGGDTICGLVDDGSLICNARTRVENRTPAGLPQVVDVAAGLNSVCAILEGGELTCWGNDVNGLLDFPTGDAPYHSVSISNSHACVINNADEVECWGLDRNDRLVAPEGSFQNLSLGVQQACAVDTNNRVSCWGANDQGATDVPNDLPDALMADSSFGTSCALTIDGNIECWGTPLATPQGNFLSMQVDNQTVCGLNTDQVLQCLKTRFVAGQVENVQSFSSPDGISVSQFSFRGNGACYVTAEGELDCIGTVFQEIPVIEGNTPVPATTGLRADVNSATSLELFWDAPRDAFNVAGHEVIRNGEVYAFTQNASSFFIDDIMPGESLTFAVQRVSIEDRRGPASETIAVNGDGGGNGNGNGGGTNPSDYQPPTRPYEPTGLDAFVYGRTAIELIWDRVNTSEINGYEIRRDGVFVGFTNGTSFFEELSVSDKNYRYDVIPVNRDDPARTYGFSSITVGLGSADGGVCL